MMMAIGIDPGKEGFVVGVSTDGVRAFPAPTVRVSKSRYDYDVAAMVSQLQQWLDYIDIAVLEKQQAMPDQGVASTCAICRSFGLWEGILAGLRIPYRVVHPRTWQAVMLRDVPGDHTKGRAIIAAGRLFPGLDLRKTPKCRTPHNGKADAALMAWYGLHVLLGRESRESCHA